MPGSLTTPSLTPPASNPTASKYLRRATVDFQTTLTAVVNSTTGTIPLTSTTDLSTDSAVTLVIEPDTANEEVIIGFVEGLNIVNCARHVEGATIGHPNGAIVAMYETAIDFNSMVDAIRIDHGPQGNHKTLTDTSGNEWMKQTATLNAVNEVTLANAATGNDPQFSASGDDANVGIKLKAKGAGLLQLLDGSGNAILKTLAGIASAVNYVSVQNAATGGAPEIQGTGADTDVHLKLTGKGAGGALIDNPFKFLGYRSAAGTLGNLTQVVFDAESYDTGSNFNTTNGRFVAPMAGVYHFDALISWAISGNANIAYGVALYKNGSLFANGNVDVNMYAGSFTIRRSGSWNANANAGDYFEVYAIGYSGGNAIEPGSSASFFSGHLVSI